MQDIVARGTCAKKYNAATSYSPSYCTRSNVVALAAVSLSVTTGLLHIDLEHPGVTVGEMCVGQANNGLFFAIHRMCFSSVFSFVLIENNVS